MVMYIYVGTGVGITNTVVAKLKLANLGGRLGGGDEQSTAVFFIGEDSGRSVGGRRGF